MDHNASRDRRGWPDGLKPTTDVLRTSTNLERVWPLVAAATLQAGPGRPTSVTSPTPLFIVESVACE